MGSPFCTIMHHRTVEVIPKSNYIARADAADFPKHR
jgi:hypothetical protein